MIDDCPVGKNQSVVYRIAATHNKSIDAILLERGIDLDSIEKTKAEIARVGGQYTAEGIVRNSFRGRANRLKAFPKTRFSDGAIGIFYSALEVSTCEKEITFHLEIEADGHSRYYSLITCKFSGITADLRGKETVYPDLVSQTESGYPFCQRLGRGAKEKNIDAFYTPSAREEGGTCVPVFTETALSKPEVIGRVKVSATSDGVEINQI